MREGFNGVLIERKRHRVIVALGVNYFITHLVPLLDTYQQAQFVIVGAPNLFPDFHTFAHVGGYPFLCHCTLGRMFYHHNTPLPQNQRTQLYYYQV